MAAEGFGTGRRDGLRLSLETFNTPSTSAVSPAGGAGVPTITTPTVTPSPSALRNIEQLFLAGESGAGNGTSARFVPPLINDADGHGTPATDGAHDLSTPTIANVILDMSMNNEGLISKPTTVEHVVRQLQEAEQQAPPRLPPPPPLVIVPPPPSTCSSSSTKMTLQPPPPPLLKLNRPTSLSLNASSTTNRKRKSLQTVINQLSPNVSAAKSPFASLLLEQSKPSLAIKQELIEKMLPVEPTPLHSLASVSAIQNPLPVHDRQDFIFQHHKSMLPNTTQNIFAHFQVLLLFFTYKKSWSPLACNWVL